MGNDDWQKHMQDIAVDHVSSKIKDQAIKNIRKIAAANKAVIVYEKLNKGFTVAKKINEVVSVASGPKDRVAGDLLKLAYQGVGHIASGNPVMEKFVAYHDRHIALLATSVTALNNFKSIIGMYHEYNRVSDNINNISKETIKKYNYVYDMLDKDSFLPANLPKAPFKSFYPSLRAEEDEILEEWVMENNGKRLPVEFYIERISLSSSEYHIIKASEFIIKTYNEVAALKCYVENEGHKYVEIALKISSRYTNMTKSGGYSSDEKENISFIGGKSAESKLKFENLNRNSVTDIDNLLRGDIIQTMGFKKTQENLHSVKKLCEEWRKWSKMVLEKEDFINSF